jgi:cytochrome c oxidase assembly factor CtaG
MPPTYLAVVRSWSVPPAATFALVLTAIVYLRGWWLLWRARVPFLPLWRAIAFLAGLLSLWVALASPMDVFNGFLLTAHMLQHMLLMMLAPPLVLLGAPLIPVVRGLPVFAAREFAGPFLNWPVAKRAGRALTNPIFALLLMGVVMFAWHTPAFYELALRSSTWHQTEHACFFLTSLVFWWPVVQPWPSRAQWPRWAMVPYLLIADLQNTVLSAILVFSDRVLYPWYSATPRLFGLSALEDQITAGSIMWVVGSLAFVVPAIVIAVQCLSRKSLQAEIAFGRRLDVPPFDGQLPVPERGVFLRRWVRQGGRGGAADAISFVVLFVAASLCFAWLLSSTGSDDDDQAVRYRGQSESVALTVVARPGDLPTGAADFGVLVQDRNTQEVMLDATVDLTAQLESGAPRSSSTVRATHEDSQNKLLQSAELKFPREGDWMLNVSVQRGSEAGDFSMPLHVVKADTSFELPLPYSAIGLFSILLAFVYISRHRPGATTSKKPSTGLPMPSPAASARSRGSSGSA